MPGSHENLYGFIAFAFIAGVLMIAFPSIFISLADTSAAARGYQPTKVIRCDRNGSSELWAWFPSPLARRYGGINEAASW